MAMGWNWAKNSGNYSVEKKIAPLSKGVPLIIVLNVCTDSTRAQEMREYCVLFAIMLSMAFIIRRSLSINLIFSKIRERLPPILCHKENAAGWCKNESSPLRGENETVASCGKQWFSG